nr:ABC transporter ATP-binding protein [Acidobacteriota bacterium]
RQNLRFFGGVYGLPPRELKDRIGWAARMAQLEGREDLLTGSLPGGWKQRLALASALLHQPQLVFLDEPTGGVDPIARRQFWSLIDALAAEGLTVLVTTHYLDEAEHCDRLALMHAGRLIAHGSVRDLKHLLGEKAVLEVSTPRPLEALDLLVREPWAREVTLFGNRLHVVTDEREGAAERAVALLTAAGLGPAGAEPIVPSLEDVFIHAIGAAQEARA